MMTENTKINVFKNKNYVLLFFGVLFSNTAYILFNFAMSLYVLRVSIDAFGREDAPLFQAIYLAVGGIILLLLTPFGGSLADKLSKVKIMVITDFIRGIVILLSGIMLFILKEANLIIILLFVVTIILSINSAFFTPASGSLMRFILKDHELQQGASLLAGSHSLQNIIGLILGGIFYVSLGVQWIFIINGIGYIISAITEIFIKYDKSEHAKDSDTKIKSMLIDIKTGMKYLVSAKSIFTIILMALMINFFFSPLFSNGMPYFIEYGLKLEPTFLFDQFLRAEHWLSIISVTFSVSAVVTSLILASKKPKTTYGIYLKKIISFMSLSVILSNTLFFLYYIGAIPVNTLLILGVISFLGTGFAMVALHVPFGVLLQTKVEKSQLGKVNSLMNVLAQALIPVSSLVAGIVISKIGIIYLYLYCSIGIILVTLWFLRNKNTHDL